MPCIVRGCTSGYPRNSEKVHFFTVPADPRIRRLWKEAINNNSVNAGRVVCEKHFKQDEILWQRKFMNPLGQVVGVGQYKIPRLSKGSVPSIFPWTKKVELEIELPRNEQSEQIQFNEENLANVLPVQEQHARSSSNEEKITDAPTIIFGRQSPMLIEEANTITVEGKQSSEISPKIDSAARDTLTFEELLTRKLCLPSGWFQYSSGCDGKKLITFFATQNVRVQESYDIRVVKNVIVTEDMAVELKVSGFLYRQNEVTVPRHATSIEELQDLFLRIHYLNVCGGVPNSTTFGLEKKFGNLRQDANNTWRHTECLLLLTKKTCVNCKKAKDAIVKFKRRHTQRAKSTRKKKCLSPIEEKHKSSLLHTRHRSALRATRLATKKLKVLRKEVTAIRNRLRQCSNEDLEQHVKDGKIPENYLYVVQEIVKATKHRNAKGRIYSEQWMLLCMLLHSRSASGYDFLRRNNVLPLPCPRTIRRYLSKMKATCGFDSQFFEVLKVVLNKKREPERHGILLVDEMATRESVAVNTRELTYKGLIDFGSEGSTLPSTSDKANHGLVFMFQSLDADYCQPIAVFASRGPVKGDVLAPLIIKAIILLENIGAKVHGVVSDGASTNRKAWSELGICGEKNSLRNYFDHPVDEQRKVYIFSDTPHLFKTIRNRLNNKGILQLDPSEQPIKWKFIELLHLKDREFAGPGQALVCPKLTANHIYLNNSLKMRVRLAVQVFSNAVSAGLLFFKNYEPEMEGCEATASFCKWLNDLFDALNRTESINGVQPGHSDFKEIQESLRKLDAWEEHVQKGNLSKELFLTQQTAEGLRITLKSMLDLIEYLTQQCSFPYVLTGRVNQDPLERFFGTVRQAGGYDDHPSTPTFLNLYKILSTFSALKPPRTGNCTINVHPQSTEPLVTLADLNTIYGNPAALVDLSDAIQKKLQHVVKFDDWDLDSVIHITEHDYNKPSVSACVLYCLTTDLAVRLSSKNKCSQCTKALLASNPANVLPAAMLKKWEKGDSSVHPNPRLYNLVVFLDQSFQHHCHTSQLFENIMDDVYKHEELTFPCRIHSHAILFHIIRRFVTMRMQQYCRRTNADQQKECQAKKKAAKHCKS